MEDILKIPVINCTVILLGIHYPSWHPTKGSGMDATAQKTSDFKNLEHSQPGSSSLHTVKLANNSLAKVTHSGSAEWETYGYW